jgi:hypothetical protein
MPPEIEPVEVPPENEPLDGDDETGLETCEDDPALEWELALLLLCPPELEFPPLELECPPPELEWPPPPPPPLALAAFGTTAKTATPHAAIPALIHPFMARSPAAKGPGAQIPPGISAAT